MEEYERTTTATNSILRHVELLGEFSRLLSLYDTDEHVELTQQEEEELTEPSEEFTPPSGDEDLETIVSSVSTLGSYISITDKVKEVNTDDESSKDLLVDVDSIEPLDSFEKTWFQKLETEEKKFTNEYNKLSIMYDDRDSTLYE